MSTNVPTISVTSAFNKYDRNNISTSSDSEDNSDSNSNDMDYNSNISGGFTDVEDFDTNAEFDKSCSRRSSKNSLFIPKGSVNSQGDVTDVEDYNDSDCGEEDVDYPELKISLEEFLQHDAQEHLSTTNGTKEMVKHKSGDFLTAQNLNAINDYLTDCEEYNTDSEIETKCEKSAIVDLDEAILEQGKVNIADSIMTTKVRSNSNCDYEDASVISDVSDLASALSDVMEKDVHGLSEAEDLELDGNEENIEISYSDSDSSKNGDDLSEEDLLSNASLPPIDVMFIHPSNRDHLEADPIGYGTSSKRTTCKGMFLKVKENQKEEVLTDIERFDDSVAEDNDDSFDEDDGNQRPIPQAVILAIGDDGACNTDCEDFLTDDISEATDAESGITIDNNTIPLPHREVVVLQENKFGDTITNVMPMGKEYQFGIYKILKEECITDTEEFSCADDDDDIQELTVNLPSRSLSPNNMVMVESDVTISNEILKSQQNKRLEIISNAESVTDVEEIFMAGTNSRKKKVKTRNISKNKSKYLEAPRMRPNLSGDGTDIEDMDLSESGLQVDNNKPLQIEENLQTVHSLMDKTTDIEEITADDASSMSEIEPPQIGLNLTNLKDYDDSSKNYVVSLVTCGTTLGIKHNINKKMMDSHFKLKSELSSNHNQQQHTDIEDMQLPSDAEECLHINEPTADTVCQELSEMLNECCTTVHDKCSNSFNVDAEKLYIKGMLRESHTDIEYVESDESAARGSK